MEEMYPVIRDAVLFFHDFLVEDHGELVTCPSISPENVFVLPSGMKGSADAGCTMDNEILRDLMGSYLKMSEILGISDEETKTTETILAKLPGYKIGKYGQLQEWRKDYDENEPGHRHISHLYALHPSSQITPDRTPELAQAAAKTLERRLEYGGGHTGWSCAWIVNMYARLFDGQNAWKNLQKMFEKSTAPNRMSTHPGGNGYLFQIDGNYGATSGIMEMVLQSDEERTILLPAIPERWNSGSVKGLVMCSGALVDMEWKDGKVISCVIHGKNRFETVICVNGEKKHVTLESGKEYKIV